MRSDARCARRSSASRARSSWRSAARAWHARLAARPIDIDLLVFDGEVVQPQLAQRPYNAVPLAEIAPHVIAAAERRRRRAPPRARAALRYRSPRRSARRPPLAQSRRRFERAPHRAARGRRPRARLQRASSRWSPTSRPIKAGVHMSRFAELLEEATLDVLGARHEAGAHRGPRRSDRAGDRRQPARDARRRAAARRLRARALDAGQRQARRGDLHADRHRARRRTERGASSASRPKA